MSASLITTTDENKIPFDVIRFCTSVRQGKKTGGDKIRVQINIYDKDNLWSVQSVTFDRVAWENFKQSVDEGFAEFPVT